jgi:FixJ family two-component response regulator
MVSIVDDDESVREATKGLVRSLGYPAATFASAEEFLRSGQADDTACLISDVQMPGLSGVELQRRLLAQGYRIPVIFITAFPEGHLRARAMSAGAVCFLSKPFPEDKLIAYLHAALNAGDGAAFPP